MESNSPKFKKIIVIDDDEDLLYTFNYWLTRRFLTIALTDTIDLKSYITHFQPDLILIDVRLKEVDGRHICRYIKTELDYLKPVIHFSLHDYNPNDFDGFMSDGFFKKCSDHIHMILEIMKYL